MRELANIPRPDARRPDPRVALAAALAMILAVSASTGLLLPLAAFSIGAIAALLLRASPRQLLLRLLGPLGLALVIGLLRCFLTGHTPIWTISLGGWHPTATREGLAAGILVGGRVLGCVSAAMLLSLLAGASELFAALRWARMPQVWVEIAAMMYRHIFGLFEQAASIRAAQRTRLGYGGWSRSMASTATLVGSVALRSLDQADRTHEAMLARGYHGTLHLRPLAPLRALGWSALIGLPAIVAAAWLLLERGLP